MEINNYIRLTPSLPSKQGWLWSKVPLISNNWEIEFEYKVNLKIYIYIQKKIIKKKRKEKKNIIIINII